MPRAARGRPADRSESAARKAAARAASPTNTLLDLPRGTALSAGDRSPDQPKLGSMMGGRCRALAAASPQAGGHRRRQPRSSSSSTARQVPLLLLLALAAAACVHEAHAQISSGRTHDSHWFSTGSKFLSRRAENDAAGEAPGGWVAIPILRAPFTPGRCLQ